VSALRRVWAKSPRTSGATGELLTAHLEATLRAAAKVHDRVGDLDAVPQRFWVWAHLAALLHDAGKIADGFQTMVGNGPEPAQPWRERHEVLSLGFAAPLLAGLPAQERQWVALGILTHHRPLTSVSRRGIFGTYDEADPAAFATRFGHIDHRAAAELLSWLAATASRHGLVLQSGSGGPPASGPAESAHALLGQLRDEWQARADRDRGRCAVLLQGAVTLADHLSSAHSVASLHTVQPVGAAYAAELARRLDLHAHQQRAAEVDGHLLLRAPTGAGKTEAAQLWAARQVEALRARHGGQPRVFYTLPYLASINAMTERLGASLGDDGLIGVAHSRAALYHLDRSLREDSSSSRPPRDPADASSIQRADAAGKAVSRAAATRLFRELVRVGTPYQLLRGALAGAGGSGILIDSANSVFILDELHAYDTRRLGFILAMTRLWEQLGGRIAVISATLPDPLATLLTETLEGNPTTVEAMDRSWPVRHRLVTRADHLTADASVREIKARLVAGQAVLVVANNVADARALFEEIAPDARRHHGGQAADLLHARFRAMDRNIIEGRIRARYGTGAARKPGLVVATQVVEVSLDVDFDALHTSGAPLDALIQRFGRVNRLGQRQPADVVVHSPGYRARRDGHGELWADGVYETEPTELAMQILARHDGAELSEHRLAEWLDEIHQSGWGEQWRSSVTGHRRAFDTAFLSFALPFDDRQDLQDQFDQMFNGTEAILEHDKDDYTAELNSAHGPTGRLLGSQYLIPLPNYARHLGRYDKDLKVVMIDADYDPRGGLGAIHSHRGSKYEPGAIL
jgi:CRISPR-associated helicase Cas3/CRISPR-associated endonuclease Cas3-HD